MKGGKREGAGRKKVLTYETTVIKIPLPLKEFIKSIVNYEISNYNQKGKFSLNNPYQKPDYDLSNDNHNMNLIDENQIIIIKELIKTYESNMNNSPRWAQAKKLLKALNLILNHEVEKNT